jgi:hypothetical protein
VDDAVREKPLRSAPIDLAAALPVSMPRPRATERVEPEAESISVSVTFDQATDLHHSIPVLVRDVRRQLRRRRGNPGDRVTIDLSAVPPVPACAPLLLLFGLVRRVVGAKPDIVVTGTSPALAACLVAGLPEGVVVVDQSDRRWQPEGSLVAASAAGGGAPENGAGAISSGDAR